MARTDKLLQEEPTARHWCVQGRWHKSTPGWSFSRSWDWQAGSGQCVCIPLLLPKTRGRTHPALLALLPVEHVELEGRSHVCQLHQQMVPICQDPQLGWGQGSCNTETTIITQTPPSSPRDSPEPPWPGRRGERLPPPLGQHSSAASVGHKPLCSSQEQIPSRRGTMTGVANGNVAIAELHTT